MKAPPRRIVAPAAFAISRGLEGLLGDSTAHGPAMNVNVSGPIGTWWPGRPTQTVAASGMVLAADQLVGVGDAVHVGDAAQGPQVEVVERLDVADQPDDGADDALADEGLAADALDPLDDAGDVLVGGVG